MPLSSNKLLAPDNHLFTLARAGRLRLPNNLSDRARKNVDDVFYPLLVLLFGLITPLLIGILLLPFVALLLLLRQVGLAPSLGAEVTLFLALLGSFLPFYPLVWAWLRLFERRPLWTAGLEWPGWAAKYGRGLLIGLLMFAAVTTILLLLGVAEVGPSDRSHSWPAVLGLLLLLLLGWMVQAGAEELLARGLVLPVFGARFGVPAGVAISALLFAAIHLFNPHLTALAILNFLLFGLFAALFAIYEGGLWGIFAIHATWNWAQSNLFGFAVSGAAEKSQALFNLMETGPDWLTGGAFGPEGGIAVTLVLILSTVLLWLAARQSP